MLDLQEISLWSDALLVARLAAVDPYGLGGICLRARSGPLRDAWLEFLRGLLPKGEPVRKIPVQVGDDRLLGSLDLTATLQTGLPVTRRGLLAESDGGWVLLPMAERMPMLMRAHLTAAMDTCEVRGQRDGMTKTERARFAVIALDEGSDDGERAPPQLLDRLAFILDLSPLVTMRSGRIPPDSAEVQQARMRLPSMRVADSVCAALTQASMQLGVASIRASILAVRAACAIAALDGRSEVTHEDAKTAARLVISPRSTRVPNEQPEESAEASEAPTEERDDSRAEDSSQADAPQPEAVDSDAVPSALDDLILQAAVAAIPAGLLQQLKQGKAISSAHASSGRVGASRQSLLGGRPTSARRGKPGRGARIHLIETLRAAAPWQTVRRRDIAALPGTRARVQVRAEDLRIVRFRQRMQTTTIFAVDASGSAALNRLAEAKGAVELLLAECYVRRDEVCVISFRATTAEVVLPPTRSLPRAKRELAGLPGGGGTPLATGIRAAVQLADQVRRSGRSATIVLLTDGCANVALDGSPGRQQAEKDAMEAARCLRAAGISTVLIDISRRAQRQAEELARHMDARFVWLPYADSARLSAAIKGEKAAP